MNKETIQSIIEWHKKIFPDATFYGQKEKYNKEFQEWYMSGCKDISELADMVICACGVARFSIVDALYLFKDCIDEASKAVITLGMLETAIEKKMGINRKRKWNFQDGQYQHKE